MSRGGTATPPPPFFPHRNSTPTMRHFSSPKSQSEFANRSQTQSKRRAKQFFGVKTEPPKDAELGGDALALSFEAISEPDIKVATLAPEHSAIFRTQSVASASTSISIDSYDTSRSGADSYHDDRNSARSSFVPSMSTSSSSSFIVTPLATPASSRAPSFIQTDVSIDSSLPSPIVSQNDETPIVETPTAKTSWVPNFGKMAKAVVHHGMNISPFGEKRSKKTVVTSKASSPVVVIKDEDPEPPTQMPRPSQLELEDLDIDAAMQRRREWAAEQQKRIHECAMLCSQWPQSGYNQLKWGPNGSQQFYEPQSYCNPQYVSSIMARQARLERELCDQSALFFSCRRLSRSPSDNSSAPSMESYESSQSSRPESMSLSADISAAMASQLLDDSQTVAPLLPAMQLTEAKSMSDLRTQTGDGDLAMDVDSESVSASPSSLSRQARSTSCGSKRPSTSAGEEEEKRRRIDEAMVVEEAVETGVIMPNVHRPRPMLSASGRQMSASTPNLIAQAAATDSAAMFGHVVKTSDTHPIIISQFLPSELMSTISQNLAFPFTGVENPFVSPQLEEASLLSSKIDIPSLLLSFVPPQAPLQRVLVPSPVQSHFAHGITGRQERVGNLLLSSCPGKRLRMEGPVKGRGPVCRDLATDMRRIKNEGVGCLICCLDDDELALLGVPWETYREVTAEIGLDVIRLPMPDGFTPVSLPLFDSQITLIVNKYSLRGVNVLVHCRGGVGRAGLTASAWAIKMGFVSPHPSLAVVEEAALRRRGSTFAPKNLSAELPAELEHQIVMSMVERVIAMIRSRRGLKAIESFEQVQFLATYVRWLRSGGEA